MNDSLYKIIEAGTGNLSLSLCTCAVFPQCACMGTGGDSHMDMSVI